MAGSVLGELLNRPQAKARVGLGVWISWGGAAVWGYRLMVRDVSGVPVVAALEGPLRVAPDDPGGQQADFQGLEVNEVQAEGTAGQIADRLVLAPPSPDLKPTDLPVADLMAADIVTEPTLAPGISETDAAVLAALDGDDPAVFAEGADNTALTAIDPISADIPGVAVSLHPVARPALAPVMPLPVTAQASVTEVVADQPLDAEVLAASLPEGARLVQLGAFDSPAEAKAEWVKLTEVFSDVMDGKSLVVQEATSGGKVFYRLRAAGFADMADADRFCALISAGNERPCIPVVAR
jgi:hypothetical protein